MIKNNIQKIKRAINNIQQIVYKLDYLKESYERDLYGYKSFKVNLGQIQAEFNSKKEEINDISEVEFQVFSQFGDDGIIQWLINRLDIENKTFVEFGVEKYIESNTRFLLFNNNWNGLVIDGDKKNIDYIKNDIVSCFFNLQSVCSFITKDNIRSILKSKGFDKEIGILSVDIDGNDYWVLKEIIDIKPEIIICEYNAEFGLNPWTIPYKEDFVWDKESNVYYWGASLKSFCDLCDEKDYSFIGCNSHGNNAYFIRNDKMIKMKKLSCEEGFKASKFSLERTSSLEQYSKEEKMKKLINKEIFNTITNKIEIIK
jgi:hypothetical protein